MVHTKPAVLVMLATLLLAGCADPVVDEETEAVDDWLGSSAEDAAGTDGPKTRGNVGWHVHDYWGGETQMTLYEGTTPVTIVHNHMLDEPPREQHLHGCDGELVSDSQGGSIEFALPDGEIVPPGTDEVEFTFSWDDPTITGVRFRFRPTAEAHGHDHGEHDHTTGYTDLGPVPNGEPIRANVTPEMTDLGHDLLSHWRFILCADSEDSQQDLAEGAVQTKIVAYRAEELAMDPPHPDHWANGTTLPLAHYEWDGTATAALNKGDGSWHRIPFDEGAIVPVLTDHIKVDVHHNVTATSGPTETGFLLYWKDSTTTDWDYRWVEPAETTEGRVRFHIPIDSAGMVDSQYAQTSNWDIWIRITASDTAPAPSGLGTWSAPHVFEGDLSVAAQAVKFQD